jgi:cardiolipin synthase
MWKITKQNKFKPFLKQTGFVKDFAIRTNAPHRQQRFIYRELLDVLRTAKQSVYLTTPYFIPDFRFFRIVRLLAKKGIDVRLLVPASSDHVVVDLASQSHFTLLLKAGVKIYEYKGTMMHAKTVIVDDTWATVGSFNLDNLSFLFNHEANVMTSQKELISALTVDFFLDLKNSEQVVPEVWYHRSWIRKVLEICTWPLHQLL